MGRPMNQAKPPLPPFGKIEVGKLSAAFRHRTNSYKYLFLKGILQCYKEKRQARLTKGEPFDGTLPFIDIRDEMLVNALASIKKYNLNFGTQDKIYEALNEVQRVFRKHKYQYSYTAESIKAGLKKHAEVFNSLKECPNVVRLRRYVPHLLLSPWFTKSEIGKHDGDHSRQKRISSMSESFHEGITQLYKINKTKGDIHTIQLHPIWLEYLDLNLRMVEGWLDAEWIQFLQARNPATPGIAKKIWALPTERSGELSTKRRYWEPILREGFSCIYTKTEVSSEDFDLDHFIPWSYVAHDLLWNLVPTSSSTNREKGARVPDENVLVDGLAEANILMIKFTQAQLLNKVKLPRGVNWKTIVDDFGSGLCIPIDKVEKEIDTDKIRIAYRRHLPPQARMAIEGGFEKLP